MDGAAHGTGPRKADHTRRVVDSSAFYVEAYHYFHQRLPVDLRAHRVCSSVEGRGVGADALHVTWYPLFEAFRIEQFLAIGVYRGQVVCLALFLQRVLRI